jgi:hypothetical protein
LLCILRRRRGGIVPARRRLLQEFPPSCITHIIRAQELDELIIGRALRRRRLLALRRRRGRGRLSGARGGAQRQSDREMESALQ